MKQTNTRRTALLGMLFALAMVLSFLEGSLVPLLGLPPGVKLGLANVVVMYALFFLGKADAGMLVVLKSAFSFFTRGASAGALSLAGGVLSLLV
ncbi:MAG: Gx transporter family protein, partial [Ruthenibacterium sp.]